MSAKCVKSYFNVLVFLSFCHCEVKIHFLFSFLVLLFVFVFVFMSAIPFIKTYKNFRKVAQCKEFTNIYDDVPLKLSNCPIFPRRIKLQYEDEEVNDFIDLDSPIQLDQRISNRINVLEGETHDTDSM